MLSFLNICQTLSNCYLSLLIGYENNQSQSYVQMSFNFETHTGFHIVNMSTVRFGFLQFFTIFFQYYCGLFIVTIIYSVKLFLCYYYIYLGKRRYTSSLCNGIVGNNTASECYSYVQLDFYVVVYSAMLYNTMMIVVVTIFYTLILVLLYIPQSNPCFADSCVRSFVHSSCSEVVYAE